MVLHGYQLLFESSHHYKHCYAELAVIPLRQLLLPPFFALPTLLDLGRDCELGSALENKPPGAVRRLFAGRPSLFSDRGNFLFPPALS